MLQVMPRNTVKKWPRKLRNLATVTARHAWYEICLLFVHMLKQMGSLRTHLTGDVINYSSPRLWTYRQTYKQNYASLVLQIFIPLQSSQTKQPAHPVSHYLAQRYKSTQNLIKIYHLPYESLLCKFIYGKCAYFV